MQWLDVVKKKRDGHVLTKEEIFFLVQSVTNASVPDYQISALLMAMFIRGLSASETFALTLAMAESGDMLPIRPGVCDKHSTGGTGDTTTFVLLPLVMAAGGKMAKISGRGLGHTGGTVDKAEAIPGFRTDLTEMQLDAQLARIGGALTAQTGHIAPADKILYALRDVTGTVESMPLIAASIMSKKLALGAEKIVLDVKCGRGAFMKTEAAARDLARTMLAIGRRAGRKVSAVLTRMDAPLGSAVGNSLEIMEAIRTLQGKNGPLLEVSLTLASLLTEKPKEALRSYIENGAALSSLRLLIEAQGGDSRVLTDFSHFKAATYTRELHLSENGYIAEIDGEALGHIATSLGAGRLQKEDSIDHAAGLYLHKTIGDRADGLFCTLYTDREDRLGQAEALVRSAVEVQRERPKKQSIIIDIME